MNAVEYHKIRVIAYTNDAVKTHNKRIRGLLGRGSIPEVGELLMGYNNIGFPEPYISNGQDYYVTAVSSTKAQKIETHLSNNLQLFEHNPALSREFFFPAADFGGNKSHTHVPDVQKFHDQYIDMCMPH